jgi:CHAT domain-containing protein
LFAKTLNTLASLLARMHDHEEAKRLLERSLAISEGQLGAKHPDVVQTRADLADLFVRMGLYASAESLHVICLTTREELFGREHPSVVASVASLAAIARERGAYADAESLYARVLATHEGLLGAEHPEVARDLTALAQVSALTGRNHEALENALRAEELGRNHLRLTSRVLPERQALQYASVRAAGLDLALSVVSPDEPQAVRRTWDSLVRSRALVLDEMAARHRSVAGAGDPEVAALESRLASASARFANLMVRGPGKDPVDRYRALLEEARREREDAEEELAGRSAAFRQRRASESVGLDAVARALPPGCAMVAFALYDRYRVAGGESGFAPVPSYAAFVLPAGAAEPVALTLGPADEIDALVSRWQREAARGALDPGRSPEAAEAVCRRHGAALRERIWDPVASHLGRAERVFVIPDGALNLVSLAALPVGDSRYLVEAGPLVHYLSAERDIATNPAEHPRGVGLLAVGGPAFDEPGRAEEGPGGAVVASGAPIASPAAPAAPFRGERSGCAGFESVRFEPLPASLEEVDEIASLWNTTGARGEGAGEGGAHVLTGAFAGETAFKRSAPGRRVLHLATHGFFLGGDCRSALQATRGIGTLTEEATPDLSEVAGENPLHLSGLALAGANRRDAVSGEQDDGILTAEEIAALDLLGAEWVVVSACESGVGDVHAGEGVVGLRRAFQVAGAGTLITSLWSVDDQSTREWMKALYDARLRRNLDTAECVGRASVDVLQSRRARGLGTHPLYWAAFVAAGEWR